MEIQTFASVTQHWLYPKPRSCYAWIWLSNLLLEMPQADQSSLIWHCMNGAQLYSINVQQKTNLRHHSLWPCNRIIPAARSRGQRFQQSKEQFVFWHSSTCQRERQREIQWQWEDWSTSGFRFLLLVTIIKENRSDHMERWTMHSDVWKLDNGRGNHCRAGLWATIEDFNWKSPGGGHKLRRFSYWWGAGVLQGSKQEAKPGRSRKIGSQSHNVYKTRLQARNVPM